MRILILGIALLALTCSAFAETSVDDGTAVVSLTVERYVTIAGSQNSAITMAGNDTDGAETPDLTPVKFTFTTNCPADISTSIANGGGTLTAGSGLVWKIRNASETGAFVAGPLTHAEGTGGVTEDLAYDAQVTGLTTALIAGTNYGATLTATITAR